MPLDDFKQIIRLKESFHHCPKNQAHVEKSSEFFFQPNQKLKLICKKTQENVPRCLKIFGQNWKRLFMLPNQKETPDISHQSWCSLTSSKRVCWPQHQ
jgi:hypothetical protein